MLTSICKNRSNKKLGWGDTKGNKALSNDDRIYIYIYKFMLQNENTESIKALQETFIKEHLSIIGFYLIL